MNFSNGRLVAAFLTCLTFGVVASSNASAESERKHHHKVQVLAPLDVKVRVEQQNAHLNKCPESVSDKGYCLVLVESRYWINQIPSNSSQVFNYKLHDEISSTTAKFISFTLVKLQQPDVNNYCGADTIVGTDANAITATTSDAVISVTANNPQSTRAKPTCYESELTASVTDGAGSHSAVLDPIYRHQP